MSEQDQALLAHPTAGQVWAWLASAIPTSVWPRIQVPNSTWGLTLWNG
jgi:hypothetical protein